MAVSNKYLLTPYLNIGGTELNVDPLLATLLYLTFHFRSKISYAYHLNSPFVQLHSDVLCLYRSYYMLIDGIYVNHKETFTGILSVTTPVIPSG